MTTTRRDALKIMGAASLTAGATTLLPTGLMAESHEAMEPMTHEVMMYTKHPDDSKLRNVFSPRVLQVNPGDTVKFVSADKGHNSVSDENMLPEGAEEWKGKISKDLEVVISAEGTYGYFCAPHRALGMVGLILCGDPSSNYEDARGAKQRGKAKKAYAEIFEEADALIAG